MSKHHFVVLGLGGFGETIATELTRLGNDVLGIDWDERRVDHLAGGITHAAVADVSDEKALRELNLKDYDAAVIAIGESIEASILATLHLKAIGINEIWVKAFSAEHHRILVKLGATRIIHPEQEMGLRVAQTLNYPMVNNYMDVGDDEYVVDIVVAERMNERKMRDVIEKAGVAVTVLLVRRNHKNYYAPDNKPEDIILATNDHVVLLGQRGELKKIARHL